MKLKTERLTLEILQTFNVTTEYVNNLNDPQVNKFMECSHKKQSFGTIYEYIANNSKNYLFGIFLNSVLIGTARLHNISEHHKHCGIAILIFKNYWNQGYAQETINRMVDYAFNELGIIYIECGIWDDNEASRKLFKKCGFVTTAVYPDKYLYNGKPKSVSFYCLTPGHRKELELFKPTREFHL